jgi:hypothetical protein
MKFREALGVYVLFCQVYMDIECSTEQPIGNLGRMSFVEASCSFWEHTGRLSVRMRAARYSL